MNKKQFLVEFTYDERTRWLWDDYEFRKTLAHLAQTAGETQTEGSTPSVQVWTCSDPVPWDALRFLGREAQWCRSHDEHEAFCLLLAPILKSLGLSVMTDDQARQFKLQLKETLAKPGLEQRPHRR